MIERSLRRTLDYRIPQIAGRYRIGEKNGNLDYLELIKVGHFLGKTTQYSKNCTTGDRPIHRSHSYDLRWCHARLPFDRHRSPQDERQHSTLSLSYIVLAAVAARTIHNSDEIRSTSESPHSFQLSWRVLSPLHISNGLGTLFACLTTREFRRMKPQE